MSGKPTYEELTQRVSRLEGTIEQLSRSLQSMNRSESRFRAVFHQSFQFSVILDVSGNILEMNELCHRVCGRHADGAEGKPVWEADWWKSFPDVQTNTRHAVMEAAAGKNVRDEVIFYDRDDTIRQGVRFFSPIRDAAGTVQLISLVGLDVTEIRRMEKALKGSYDRHEQILENSNAGYFLIDRDGYFQRVNRAWLTMHGYDSPQEVIGRHFSTTQVSDDLANAQRVVDRLLAGERIVTGEHSRRCRDGSIGYHAYTATPVVDNEEIIGLEGFIIDTTDRRRAERQLRELNETMDLAQKMAGLGYWRYENRSGQRTWSEQMFRILGLDPATDTPDENTLLNVWHPDDWPAFTEAFEGAKRGMPYHLIVRVIHPDGSTHYLNTQGYPYYDDNKSIAGVFGTSQDITAQIKAEAALRESEHNYRSIFENAVEGFFQSTPQGRFISVNPAFARMLGYDSTDDLTERITDIATQYYADPEDRRRYREILKRDGVVEDFEFEALRKDGSRIWVSNSTRAYFNDAGEVERYEGIVLDITERKRAEEDLRKSEQMLNETGRIAKIGGWEHDLVNRTATWTQATYDIIDIESGPIPGPDEHLDYYPPEDRAVLEDAYRKAMETGEPFDLELRCRTAAGRLIWARAIGRPVFENGRCVKMKGTFQDITERKKLEDDIRQAHKMEAVGVLAGGIAHDFNNILASILGYTELALEEAEKGSELEDSLGEIFTAGKRARDLVKQILAFARQSEEAVKPLQPSKIVKESLRLIRSSAPSTIEIRHTVESDSMILGNPSQVHQVVMNLLTNAIQAMEQSGGVLEVTMRDVDVCADSALHASGLPCGAYLALTVSDTGPGIEAEMRETIFEPYFTTKHPGEGTGMGLAVVQGIVDSYGGKVMVDSAVGGGSTFTVVLPVTLQRGKKTSRNTMPLPTGTERILFVDDEAAIARMAVSILTRLGYDVTARTSSIEALALFREKPGEFDLVITDMTMPNMTGDQLAVELMRIRPDIPVVLCTGYSKQISEETARDAGIRAFAFKPLVKSELAGVIRKVLDTEPK